MKSRLLLVILGVIFGDTGRFGGQSRRVGSWGWGLVVSASQASRREAEMVVSEPGARGREDGRFAGRRVAAGQLESWAQSGVG